MKTLVSIYIKDLLRNKMLGLLVVLVPLIFYPLLYWGITQFIMIKSGFEESRSLPLYYSIADGAYSDLKDSILALKGFVPEEVSSIPHENDGISLKVSVRSGLPAYEVYMDSSDTFHKNYYSLLEVKLRNYYETELNELVQDRNYRREYFKVYNIEPVNVDGEEVIAKIMSFLIPLMSVISVISAASAAAVELTAGHSEDRTTETTLTVPLERKHIITAKFITVVLYGIIAGLINFSFIIFMMIFIFKTMISGLEKGFASFDWSSIINFTNFSISIGSLVIVAVFVSLIFITAAGFASKRKGGNILISPFTVLITYLPLVVVIPAIEPNIIIAATPVMNISFVLKQIIAKDVDTVFVTESVLFSLLWIIAAYRFLFPLLLEEEVLLGYSNTSLLKKIKYKMKPWKKR
jgi:hypothetical protein